MLSRQEASWVRRSSFQLKLALLQVQRACCSCSMLHFLKQTYLTVLKSKVKFGGTIEYMYQRWVGNLVFFASYHSQKFPEMYFTLYISTHKINLKMIRCSFVIFFVFVTLPKKVRFNRARQIHTIPLPTNKVIKVILHESFRNISCIFHCLKFSDTLK